MNSIGIIAVSLTAITIILLSLDSDGIRRTNPIDLVEPIFHRVFGSLSPTPKLKVSWSYSYPAFAVTFESKAEMNCAKIQQDEFKREMNILFKDYGSGARRFDAEIAVFFTYPGHLAEFGPGTIGPYPLKNQDGPEV